MNKELLKINLMNRCFVNTLSILLDRVPHTVTKLSLPDTVLFNPSIVHYQDGFLLSVRSSNFYLVREKHMPAGFEYNNLWNKNYIIHFDADNKPIWSKGIDDSSVKEKCANRFLGVEDIRLFEINGAISGIGTCVSIKDGLGFEGYKAQPVSFDLKDGRINNPTLWESSLGRKIDKNWVPLVKNNQLNLVYSLDPLTIIKIDGNNASVVKGNVTDQPILLSGGTPFVALGEKYISVAHYPKLFVDKHYYYHCFVVLNSELELEEVSEPFFIQRRGIEYACGLVQDGEDLLLSYGVADRAAFYVRIPIESLYKFLFSL